jgi:hypothetical protein
MNKLSKTRRILIIPNVAAPYDQWMVKELATAFNGLGHYAAAMSSPQSATEILHLCKSFSIDIVIQVNRTRDPSIPFPSHVRHVSWYQDVFPDTLDGFLEGFRNSDILYVLGDPGVLGLNIQPPCFVSPLFTGVDQAVLDYKPQHSTQDIDISLCGGLPKAVKLHRSIMADLLCYIDQHIDGSPKLGRSRAIWILRKLIFGPIIPVNYVPYSVLLEMQQIVESFYRPLRGELDIHQLANAMWEQNSSFVDLFEEISPNSQDNGQEKLARKQAPRAQHFSGRRDARGKLVRFLDADSSCFQSNITAAISGAISYFSQSYPRIMDREALVQAASSVSASLALYGPGLSAHDFVQPYYKGVIDDKNELLDVYCRSKINLSNNTHGLGLHSRILECMAVGGFIFMHKSPHDEKPGGMLTAFEPNVHYGSYTLENFSEEAARGLKDDQARVQVGIRARSVIRERHCWHHRAQQILDDLNR